MSKNIKLNRQEIREAIENGDNAYGRRWLAVNPDNGSFGVYWRDNNAQWDPWPDGCRTIAIPALNPEGSGEESEDAQDMMKAIGKHTEAEKLIEAGDIGWVEAAEQLAPDDWKANRENALDWLAMAFLNACNGHGDDLNDPAPWGMTQNYEPGEVIQPPFEFEY